MFHFFTFRKSRTRSSVRAHTPNRFRRKVDDKILFALQITRCLLYLPISQCFKCVCV